MGESMTKERAFALLKNRKGRRLALLCAGATVGALCPHLPAAFGPICHASADVARAIAAVLGMGF